MSRFSSLGAAMLFYSPSIVSTCFCRRLWTDQVAQDESYQAQADRNSTNAAYRPGIPSPEGYNNSRASVRIPTYTSTDEDGLLLEICMTDR